MKGVVAGVDRRQSTLFRMLGCPTVPMARRLNSITSQSRSRLHQAIVRHRSSDDGQTQGTLHKTTKPPDGRGMEVVTRKCRIGPASRDEQAAPAHHWRTRALFCCRHWTKVQLPICARRPKLRLPLTQWTRPDRRAQTPLLTRLSFSRAPGGKSALSARSAAGSCGLCALSAPDTRRGSIRSCHPSRHP